jgi:hypothetical protein
VPDGSLVFGPPGRAAPRRGLHMLHVWTGNLLRSLPGYRWIAPTPSDSPGSGPHSLMIRIEERTGSSPVGLASSSSNLKQAQAEGDAEILGEVWGKRRPRRSMDFRASASSLVRGCRRGDLNPHGLCAH